MKSAFALSSLAAAAMATKMTKTDYKFFKYIAKFNKVYETTEEFYMRLEKFLEAEAKINQINERGTLMTAGHNFFSDFTQQEMTAMLGVRGHVDPNLNADMPQFKGEPSNADSKDWRDVSGVVSPVKDQGACGSCWAFSAIEAVESAWVIAGNSQVIMAPQQLVDCSGDFYNEGCNGGWYFWAYNYLQTAMTMRESDYPYTSGNTGRETACAYDASKGVTNVASY